MSTSMLHFHVMSILHVHAACPCPCLCCMSMSTVC
jgi:hypothetical protein